MLRSIICLITLIFLSLSIGACDDSGSQERQVQVRPASAVQQSTITPRQAFKEPIEPAVFELASGALSIWRNYAAIKPALLLFASHPLLNPTEDVETASIKQMIAVATDQEILRRGSVSASDTLIVSPQTVSAAIHAGLFSEILLVLPTQEKPEDISLEKFVMRLTVAGFLSAEEAATLVLKDKVISGTVRGLPFRLVHPDALPPLTGPLVMHVDLGYFNEGYVNEVKTPIYDSIYWFAAAVRDAGYKPTAVTLSCSNQEVGFSLSSRFIIRDLAYLLRNPQYLEGGTPESWLLRASALYASIMFNESRAQELTEKAAMSKPEDAAAIYDLALLRFQQADPDEGFRLLDQAVTLDRGYALSYIELADQGQSMGQWGKSFELLEKAVAAFPDNVEWRIRLAGDLIQRGRVKEASRHLQILERLNWSDVYHPYIRELLRTMQEAASVESVLPLPEDSPLPAPRNKAPQTMPPSHMGFPQPEKP